MDRKIKHLEFIQGVINRLASDSFRLKGWSVVLVSALFVLSAREGRPELVSAAIVPVFVFWGLDGYFLWQERLFRVLYDHVRVLAEDQVDFSMNVRAVGTGRAPTWLGATFSRTLLSFYAALAVAVGMALAIWLIAKENDEWLAEFSSASSTNTTYLAQWSSAIAG